MIVSLWNLTDSSAALSTADVPVKFQSDWKSQNMNLANSRLCEVLRKDVHPLSEQSILYQNTCKCTFHAMFSASSEVMPGWTSPQSDSALSMVLFGRIRPKLQSLSRSFLWRKFRILIKKFHDFVLQHWQGPIDDKSVQAENSSVTYWSMYTSPGQIPAGSSDRQMPMWYCLV